MAIMCYINRGENMSNKVFDTFEHYYECMRLSGKIDSLWNKFSPSEQKAIKTLATEIRVKQISKKEERYSGK